MDQEKQKIKIHRAEFKESPVKLTLESERPAPRTAKNLLRHIDYSSDSHRALLRQHRITRRISRKNNYPDNTVSTSFFHTLKTGQDRSTSSLLVGAPSVKEGLFCIIKARNSQKHPLAQLPQYGITRTMSRKSKCRDNAVPESCFHIPQTVPARYPRYQAGTEAKQDVFEYIASFGNNYRSPEHYEMQLKPA